MINFDADNVVDGRRIRKLEAHLRELIKTLNEVLLIGSAINKYEAAMDVVERRPGVWRTKEFVEMASKYKKIISTLRNAENFVETGASNEASIFGGIDFSGLGTNIDECPLCSRGSDAVSHPNGDSHVAPG